MKCVIPGLNIKSFARAIHSLAKIGDELYVEPLSEGVTFRTVDSSRSAFGSFFFKIPFFSSFDFKNPANETEGERFKCKVVMKACINAFRSVNIDKVVEKCKLIIDPEEDRLVIILNCRHGISKTYNLAFIECETLQAVFDKSTCPFAITSPSRSLHDAFLNFHSHQEEITLSVRPQKTVIHSYIDDEPDPAKAIHTELAMEADEFDVYKVGDSTCEITFSLKELRALLFFTEPINLPISFMFTKPGSPIIFFVESEPIFEAHFVLATLSNTYVSQQSKSSTMPPQETAGKSIDPQMVKEQQILGREHLKRPSEVSFKMHCSIAGPDARRSPSPKFLNRWSSSFNDSSSKNIPNLHGSLDNKVNTPGVEKRDEGGPSGISDVNETLNIHNRTVVEDSDEDNGEVPGTPPAKRRKYYFQRCFDPTFNAENFSQFNRILAEDSDNET